MASGLPVVSTRAVGVVDCIEDQRNGLLVNPGDVPALASALNRILTDAELRDRLTSVALGEARSFYSWQSVSRLIVDVYERLHGTSPDANWTLNRTMTPCRFRASPHLL